MVWWVICCLGEDGVIAGNVGGEVDERGGVWMGMGVGESVLFDIFFNVF